jgi:putative membrane protein
VKTLRLALLELFRFRQGRSLLVPVALALVPLVYGGVYLWATWDVYGRLDQIPVAVVNQDVPVTVDGTQVNGGQLFVQQLQQNRFFDWRFVDLQRAQRGLQSGAYSFTITVPPDFSSKLASPPTGPPRRASMLITLDDANGYLAGKLQQTAGVQLQDQIDGAARAAFAQRVLGNLTTLRQRLDQVTAAVASQSAAAKKVSDDAAKLAAGLADGQTVAGNLTTTNQRLLSGAQALFQTLSGSPAAGAAAQGVQPVQASAPAQSAAPVSQQAQLSTSAVQASDLVRLAQQSSDQGDELARRTSTAAGQASMIQTDAGQFAAGQTKLAGSLAAALQQIPPASPQQRAQIADTLSSPVQVVTTNVHPARVYGRGLAPLFFGIALWVYALVAFILLRPVNPRAVAGQARAVTVAVAGWLPAAAIGVVGALVLYGVLDGVLGLHPAHRAAAIGVVVLAALSFTALIHLLRTAFGAVGDAITLGLLTVQLTASGGLYPLQTGPSPFQAVHQAMPMTYVVDALRVTISGGTDARLIRAVIVLASILVVSLALSAVAVVRQRSWTMARLKPAVTV